MSALQLRRTAVKIADLKRDVGQSNRLMVTASSISASGGKMVVSRGLKVQDGRQKAKNIQQRGFASGHPPNY
jgi:hypothetical protein